MEERDYYLIDQSRLGNLDDVEQKEFDQRMEDPRFKSLVELEAYTHAAMQREKLEPIYTSMQRWDRELEAEKYPGRKPVLPWIVAVASIIVIFFLTYWFLIRPVAQPGSIELYAQYFEPYANVEYPTLRSSSIQNNKTTAYLKYDQEKYDQAVEAFQELPKDKLTNGDKFYFAIALMKEGEFKQSKEILLEIKEDQQYKWPANWYLFLIAVRTEDMPQVDMLGQKLINQTDFPKFSEKASHIIDVLHG